MNFNDPRSKLFFEFVDILKKVKKENPNVLFLLENVKMKKEYRDIISDHLGVEPIEINSSLVSAQNRKRFYWTNISDIKQPNDRGLLLKDIIHENRDCVYDDLSKYIISPGKNLKKVKTSEKSTKIGYFSKDSQGNRVYSTEGKSATLCGQSGGRGAKTGLYFFNEYIRKLTPIECERLQTLPDNYTKSEYKGKYLSDNQRYQLLGNGWTVDVIVHILNNINKKGVCSSEKDVVKYRHDIKNKQTNSGISLS